MPTGEAGYDPGRVPHGGGAPDDVGGKHDRPIPRPGPGQRIRRRGRVRHPGPDVLLHARRGVASAGAGRQRAAAGKRVHVRWGRLLRPGRARRRAEPARRRGGVRGRDGRGRPRNHLVTARAGAVLDVARTVRWVREVRRSAAGHFS
ncbi:hypothetical protein E1293_38140 [Actinomadura darangshiensis]|uniref:Uncharacterized protein n=1 Tax=Actinomadura darangshiensis TaxID=705336 RepID=A0A4R5A920_9ACTN|nr:hypothetical protein E1293_38140 [Actinomadura darangshiensis]